MTGAGGGMLQSALGLCTCPEGSYGCYGSASGLCRNTEFRSSSGKTVWLWEWDKEECPECACQTASTTQAKQSECTAASAAFDKDKWRCVCPTGTTSCGDDSYCSTGTFKDDSSAAYFWTAGSCTASGCVCQRSQSGNEKVAECTAGGAAFQDVNGGVCVCTDPKSTGCGSHPGCSTGSYEDGSVAYFWTPGTCGTSNDCACSGLTAKSPNDICADGGATYFEVDQTCRCPSGATGCGSSSGGCQEYIDRSNYWSQKSIFYWKPPGSCPGCVCERAMSVPEQQYECTSGGASRSMVTTRSSDGSSKQVPWCVCPKGYEVFFSLHSAFLGALKPPGGGLAHSTKCLFGSIASLPLPL